MLPRLLKFVIRTRFSRPFLVLLAVITVYSVGLSRLAGSQKLSLIVGDYAAALTALFLVMSLATGGVMVLKSDRDYLFTLPLSSKDLSIAIYFSQFIAFGTSILFMFILFAETLASPLVVVDLVALAFALTSLGVVAPSLGAKTRLLLAAALAAWTLLALLGFPLSPASAFNGNVYGGTLAAVSLSAVATLAAFRSLGRVELDMMRNLVRSTAAEIKSPISYAGKSPTRAIYSMNLSSITLAGRMNMAGTSRYVSKRVRTRWVVAATASAAIAYAVLVVLEGPPTAFVTGTDKLPAAIVVSVLLGLLSFFISQSAITNERVWLSLTSLPPPVYFRHLVASKLISLFLVLAPFAAADAVLLAVGYGAALGPLVVVLLVIPAAFVLEILWSCYVAPIQVKGEDMTMPGQFSLSQFATVLPLIPALVLASVATLFPGAAAVGGGIMVIASVALVFSGGFWERVVARLTESGFV